MKIRWCKKSCINSKGIKRSALFFSKDFTTTPNKKGAAPMKVEISVPEVESIFKEIRELPKNFMR
jgi:hypothetical protein